MQFLKSSLDFKALRRAIKEGDCDPQRENSYLRKRACLCSKTTMVFSVILQLNLATSSRENLNFPLVDSNVKQQSCLLCRQDSGESFSTLRSLKPGSLTVFYNKQVGEVISKCAKLFLLKSRRPNIFLPFAQYTGFKVQKTFITFILEGCHSKPQTAGFPETSMKGKSMHFERGLLPLFGKHISFIIMVKYILKENMFKEKQ